MSVIEKIVNGARVLREDAYNYRWLDAYGEDVVKYLMNIGMPSDNTTNDLNEWLNTETGAHTVLAQTTEGGGLQITTSVTEYQGVNMQLDGAGFKLEDGMPCYFGIKFKSENATKGDFLFGLCEIDTALLNVAGSHALAVGDDGVYFSHMNDATDINFTNELGGVEGTTAVGTTHDTDYHVYEIYYNGDDLMAYYDDELVVRVTSGIADQALTPSFNLRTGDDGAEVFDIMWLRAIQCR